MNDEDLDYVYAIQDRRYPGYRDLLRKMSLQAPNTEDDEAPGNELDWPYIVMQLVVVIVAIACVGVLWLTTIWPVAALMTIAVVVMVGIWSVLAGPWSKIT